MGQSAGSLLYDIGAPVDWKTSYHWQLFEGSKKEDKTENERVSIFKFVKASNSPSLTTSAQRNIQKLRTIKHPYILSYIDSSVLEDSILLVTESCIPLDIWLSSTLTSQNGDSLRNDILWGLHCISTALDFLHSKCKLCHNDISTQSIFVIQNGDWKFGNFDFATQPGNSEDNQYFQTISSFIPREVIAPERKGNFTVEYEGDMFSLSRAISTIFATLNMKTSDDLERFLKRMSSVEPKRRPSASSFQQCPDLNSEYIGLLNSLGDLALKTSLEAQDLIQKLTTKASDFSVAVSSYKILVGVSQRMRMAFTDFANRDSRESSRQIIQVSVHLVSLLSELNKIDEVVFRSKCIPVLNDLWTLSDRTVRYALLKGCKGMISITPPTIVNKNIFDAMLSGFADSNAKMREETLKNLVHVVDKLDEKQLQDRLVRCITNLQNDTENSIRTNSTIFLGRIASKLKDTTRHRVLCQAFAKSMRDNFSHCRIAGLKSASACMDLIDITQLATILMPQACVMMVDRNHEIRQLALSFIDSSCTILRQHHETLLKIPIEEKEKDDKSSKQTDGQGTSASIWASWAVEGISKTLERVTTTSTVDTKTINSSSSSSSSSTMPMSTPSTPDRTNNSKSIPVTSVVVESLSSNRVSGMTLSSNQVKNSEDDYTIDDDNYDNSNNEDEHRDLPPSTTANKGRSSLVYQNDDLDMDQQNSSWEDDFDWKDDTDMKIITPKLIVEESSTLKLEKDIKSLQKKTSLPPETSSTSSVSIKSSKKSTKLSVKKLQSSDDNDNWDDF